MEAKITDEPRGWSDPSKFHMSKYLAVILGLWAWTSPTVNAVVLPPVFPRFSQEIQPPDAARSHFLQDSPDNAGPAQSGAEPQSEAPKTAPEPKQPVPDATATQQPQAKAATKKRRRKKTTANASTATPEKKVVRNGGTADPAVQLGPSVSAEQASSERQNTAQLLAATDANLKQISSRAMNSSQQDSISQIRKYMEQAKAAEQAGDVQRAYNLASKARLLSDDLVKH
jgi:hypothetical protein